MFLQVAWSTDETFTLDWEGGGDADSDPNAGQHDGAIIGNSLRTPALDVDKSAEL